jgi:dihydropteroate synthase
VPPFGVAALPRRAVVGVVNVTPDSFSDGGRFLHHGAAIAHGRGLAEAGAALVDVGGESTRPGAQPVSEAEELRRVVPVVSALAGAGIAVSIDTTKAAVADAALAAGALVVNDVSAGRADPEMLAVVAARDAGFVAMHMQGTPATMQDSPYYDDVVAEVGAFLRARADAARAAGVRPDAVLADPGIGFGKTYEHNLALLGALPRLAAAAGVPLLVGASRKQLVGRALGGLAPGQRDEGTLAISVWCFVHGVSAVRVHDVASSARAAALVDVMEHATPEGVAA